MYNLDSYKVDVNNSEIEERDQLLSLVESYDIFLHLQQDFYSGNVKIKLHFTDKVFSNINEQQTLFLDFQGERIISIALQTSQKELIDENSLEFTFTDNRIKIEMKQLRQLLKQGEKNAILVISFKNKYSKIRAEGMVKWDEEEEKRSYIYCQGEVGCTSMIFPCVDNVNYRSYYQISVQHPAKWMVSSHEKYQRQEKIEDDECLTHFPKTSLPFPTYLFGFYAGEYTKYTLPYKGRVELNIYCRKNLSQLLGAEKEEYFNKISFALNYMEEYTKVNYYLEKFDVFFCPFYKDSGMETLGCISLDEYMIQQEQNGYYDYVGKVNNDIIQRYHDLDETEVLFHEIAHQWFGNLVSIEWWNDLYFKEGFANFFSSKILEGYFKNEKGIQLIDELGQFKFLNSDKSCYYQLIHQRQPYSQYMSLSTHTNVTYMKSQSLFQLLENKIYGKDKFQTILQSILKDFRSKSFNSNNLLTYFNDPITKKHLITNGYLSIENQDVTKIKQNGNVFFLKAEIELLNLEVFEINKTSNEIKVKKWKDIKTTSPINYFYILNIFDYHMVQHKIQDDVLKHIDTHKLMYKSSIQFRASIWKGVMYANNENEKFTYLNTFFLNNILSEKDDSVLHVLLEECYDYFDEFTKEDELKLLQLLEQEKQQNRWQILMVNSIRYLNHLENLQALSNQFKAQIDLLGPTIQQKLKRKIEVLQEQDEESEQKSDNGEGQSDQDNE